MNSQYKKYYGGACDAAHSAWLWKILHEGSCHYTVNFNCCVCAKLSVIGHFFNVPQMAILNWWYVEMIGN
jgi:hypothetical protein